MLQNLVVIPNGVNLENFKKKNPHYNKILEIGAGDTPHNNFIKHFYPLSLY